MTLEIGIDTFGDVTEGPDGKPLPQDAVLRNVVAEGVLADQVGLDFIGVGEHHRDDFAVSAPEIVLAAIAAKTGRIRVGSAVTVLSSDDPVRVFQRFSTLDAVSDGRAEVILGRGSFVESFPLFGYDLKDYDRLFEEKFELFVKLAREDRVTWSGTVRSGLKNQRVFPPLSARGLTIWRGVGGSPESVMRAVEFDVNLMLAIIGGDPRRFVPYADLYRRARAEAGMAPRPVGIHSPGFVAETDESARELAWPHYQRMMNRIGAERGWPPARREQFEAEVAHGSLYVGAPETVARKIASTARSLGLDRFDLKYSLGRLPHEHLMRGIELLGTRVVPLVRDMLASDKPVAAAE